MSLEERQRPKSPIDATLEQRLDELDARDALYARKNRRRGPRFIYRKDQVRCHIDHPGGGSAEVSVRTRNLSQTGLSFVYNNFLYNGARVVIWLKRRLGGTEEVQAQVAWCRHLVGVHHLIGIQFRTEIFPQLFVDPEHYTTDQPVEVVNPASLRGHVLYLEDERADQALFRYYLKSAPHVTVSTAVNGQEAVDVLNRTGAPKINVIFTDLTLQGCTGDEAMTLCRMAGYKGPFISLTAENDTRRLANATKAGSIEIIRKPYDATRLYSVLATHLEPGGVSTGHEIYSLHSDKPDMQELIQLFVGAAHDYAAKLRALSKTEDGEAVKEIALTLLGTGSSIGFPMVTEAARDVIKSITSTLSVALSASELERLLVICCRLSSKSQPRAA